MVIAALWVWGCAKDPGPPAPADPAGQLGRSADGAAEKRTDAPAPADPQPDANAAAGDPEALYASCRERVEGPEEDGECTSDADCMAAGCTGETCTTVAAGTGMMSTCDKKPCFAVLDACGCREGRCAWSIKDHVPEGASPPPRPPTPGVPPIPDGPQ